MPNHMSRRNAKKTQVSRNLSAVASQGNSAANITSGCSKATGTQCGASLLAAVTVHAHQLRLILADFDVKLMIPQTLLVEKSQGGMKERELFFRLTGGQFGCTCTSVSNGRCAGGHHCDAPFWEERFLKSDKKHGSVHWDPVAKLKVWRAARPCVFKLSRAPLVQRVSNWRERRVRAKMGPKKVESLVEALYIYLHVGLVGAFKYFFYFHLYLGKMNRLWLVFVRWVETTN